MWGDVGGGDKDRNGDRNIVSLQERLPASYTYTYTCTHIYTHTYTYTYPR